MKHEVTKDAISDGGNIQWTAGLDDRLTESRFGQKAANLSRMLRSGLPVPSGYVLSVDAFSLVANNAAVRRTEGDAFREVQLEKPATFQAASDRIIRAFREAAFPTELRDVILARADSVSDLRTLAVRSSAVGEDSAGASFAGQLDSVLNVSGEEATIRAITDVWSSYWSPRSLFYQHSRGFKLAGMGVILQHCVDSLAAGVAFSLNPENGDQRELIVEFVAGQGDGLVAGHVNPNRLRICRQTGQTEPYAGGGDDCRAVDLPDVAFVQLRQLVVQLEELFGGPQDVEWVWDGQRILIVQSRPITALSQPGVIKGNGRIASDGLRTTESDLAAGRRTDRSHIDEETPIHHWSNANVNENFPEPLTPFLYSIAREGYYHYFRNLGIAIGLKPADVQSVDHQLRHAIGTHGGRMYYNLTNIGDALRAAPLGDQLCRAFGRFVGTPESDLNTPGDGAKRFPVRDLLRIARRSSVLTFRVGSLLTEFESTIDEFAGRSDPDGLSELRMDQLHALLLEFVDIRCHRWLGGSLADSSTVIHYALLRRWLLRVYPETDVLKIQNSLLKALPGVVSSHPIEGLWKLATRVRSDPEMIRLFERRSAVQVLEEIESESRFAAFRTLFREYLEQYGFRCSGELLLTVPSFQEEPEKLISILQAYVRSDGRSPVDVMAEQASARELETTEVVATLRSRGRFKWLPWPRVSTGFRSFLTRTQQAISYRERARLKQSLLYSRLRRIVLEIGRKLTERDRLDTKEDALYFTWQELDQILTGTEMFPDSMRETVRLRREERSKLGRMQIPDSFRLPAGQYLSADQTTSGMGKGLSAVDSDSLEKSKGVLHGECACGGRVAGRAAVISGVEEFDQLREGDILVAGQTDPGWGPVFCMIGGLVLQRGGMLSHGAILAREFGIPTIVAVDHATKIIQHGDRLELNAGDGCVRIVDSQERVNGGS